MPYGTWPASALYGAAADGHLAAYNLGWLDAYDEAGYGDLVQVADGDGDSACREANGKLWTVEYARSHRSQHPNCRRRFGPPKQAEEPKVLVPLVRALTTAPRSRPKSRFHHRGAVPTMGTPPSSEAMGPWRDAAFD